MKLRFLIKCFGLVITLATMSQIVVAEYPTVDDPYAYYMSFYSTLNGQEIDDFFKLQPGFPVKNSILLKFANYKGKDKPLTPIDEELNKVCSKDEREWLWQDEEAIAQLPKSFFTLTVSAEDQKKQILADYRLTNPDQHVRNRSYKLKKMKSILKERSLLVKERDKDYYKAVDRYYKYLADHPDVKMAIDREEEKYRLELDRIQDERNRKMGIIPFDSETYFADNGYGVPSKEYGNYSRKRDLRWRQLDSYKAEIKKLRDTYDKAEVKDPDSLKKIDEYESKIADVNKLLDDEWAKWAERIKEFRKKYPKMDPDLFTMGYSNNPDY